MAPGALAARAVGESWIDAEPRAAKRSGAYCVSFGGDVSRVMMSFWNWQFAAVPCAPEYAELTRRSGSVYSWV